MDDIGGPWGVNFSAGTGFSRRIASRSAVFRRAAPPMDVRCERCRAQYLFDDEQVTPSGLTVQCTNCGHVFRVRKKELVVTLPVRPGELVGTPLPATAAAPRARERTASFPVRGPSTPREPTARATLGTNEERTGPAGLPLWVPPGALPADEVSVDVDLGNEGSRTGGGRRIVAAVAVGLAALFAGGAAVYRFHREPLVSRGPEPVEAPVRIEATVRAPTPEAPARSAQASEPSAPVAPVAATPVSLVAPDPEVAPAEPVTASAPAPAAALAPPRGPKALLAEALRLRARGQHERALDLFGRVVEAEPANVAALAGRGLCYLELERYAPAEASFQTALEHDPEHGDALLGLAETYRWQGRLKDAIKYYESYLAAHPDGEDAIAARNAVLELEE
jgi:predicted Zn finger-like uncharacterized protein